MSEFKFDCPKCGQSIASDASNAGMNITCPGCSNSITIPRAPEPPPAEPGKLSIGKSMAAHRSPASAASQPAGTTWAAKPKAPPPKQTPKWQKPVLVSVGILVVLAIGWFAVGAPMLKQRNDKIRQAKEDADRQAAEKVKAEAEAAAKAERERADWSLDLANVKFPERAASGRIHGVNFKSETNIFQRGILILRQDTAPGGQYVVYLQTKPGEALAGKSFTATSTDSNKSYQVSLSWKDETGKPAAKSFTKGYAMKLQFDTGETQSLHGKIFLCLPDVEQSFVAGDFDIASGSAPAVAGAPAQSPGEKPQPKKHKPQ